MQAAAANGLSTAQHKNGNDSIPGIYAYIVKGILYNGKWYYEKDQITYFEASTLRDGQLAYLTKLSSWGYFKPNTADLFAGILGRQPF